MSPYRKQQLKYIVADILSAIVVWLCFLLFRWLVYEHRVFSVDTVLIPAFGFWVPLCLYPVGCLLIYYLSGYYLRPYHKRFSREFVTTFFCSVLIALIAFFLIIIDDHVDNYLHYLGSLGVLFGLQFTLCYIPRLCITSYSRKKKEEEPFIVINENANGNENENENGNGNENENGNGNRNENGNRNGNGNKNGNGNSGKETDSANHHHPSPNTQHPKTDMDPRKALQMAKMAGASPEALKKMAAAMGLSGKVSGTDRVSNMMAQMSAMRKTYSREETYLAEAISEVEQTLRNVARYKQLLMDAPQQELASMINALNGGYTQPSSGGDAIANPRALPTGRNLYGVNAETTPTESAWEKGKALAENTIKMYKERHHDSIPRKVSFTFWSSEFIETGGTTMAQAFYLLGIEPLRDAFGRVTDIRLIPTKELCRPRIDVVIQTSGQFRDLAASRLYLLNRAVQMAAEAKDGKMPNMVKEGVEESERTLTEAGVSPKDAREMSTFRVFGGLNGGYGTGIQQMVQKGDSWKSEDEVADTYIGNMSAFYGSEEYWEKASKVAFKAALTRTDAVIQPRQSNTWGALSLDHVYEFMGGMNLAVRSVTGKDPDAYFADYRNRNNNRMQELKEAIGVESRSTIFNPTYIKEKMKGGANEAAEFAEIVQNTYGWNVMKPAAIDNQLWEQIYDTYVKDNMGLGINEFLREKNPAAMEQMAHTMVQTIQKGLWKTSPDRLVALQKLESELHAEAEARMRSQVDGSDKQKSGTVMKKETLTDVPDTTSSVVTTSAVLIIAVIAGAILVFIIRKRRKEEDE